MALFSPENSKLKLVVIFNDGGCTRFYSVLKHNKRTYDNLCLDMERRILKDKYSFNFKRAIFYDNTTNKEYKRLVGSQDTPKQKDNSFCEKKSLVKAVLIQPNKQAKVYYSRLTEEEQLNYDPVEIIKKMRERLSKIDRISLTFTCR